MAANGHLRETVRLVSQGDLVGDCTQLAFRDPELFRAGELHSHFTAWEALADSPVPSTEQQEVLAWIREGVSVHPYFKHFNGMFKGEKYDSDLPPLKTFKHNSSCKPFVKTIQKTLLDRVATGAISLVGQVGRVDPPHLVLPLTMEPTKPRLCHDARFLNLWMQDRPFTLDKLIDLPRYVTKDSYQTVLDDKSGYDHLLMTTNSRTYFGFQWGGWYFTYNTLPFGLKISPYVYHTTGLMASNHFRSLAIPCLLYIDDRHNGQLQVNLNNGHMRT
jgi:hypothetical protein